MLIDKTNIRELKDRYEETMAWLLDNTSAPLREYYNIANKMAILSVRISNYCKKNKA
ncbi:hypothetical protein [Phocaeicola sp.]